MKLNDKVKELTDNWTEWANCYSDINKEIEKPKPNALRLKELIEKRNHLSTKRNTLMTELQTLVIKTTEDIHIKIEKAFS